MMRTIGSFKGTAAVAALLMACTWFSTRVYASHATKFAPIDAFDHVFGAGGGTYSATTTGPNDDAWLLLAANSGDVLSITGSGIFGPNVVLFRAGTNGIAEVGDIYTATGDFDGNTLQTGTGVDLIVQDMNLRPCGDCYVSPGSDTFNVTVSGQYVIGISPANDDSAFVGTTTIDLLGNTANVPEPATGFLLSIGFVGLIGVGVRARK
jgi:hypothetical protein